MDILSGLLQDFSQLFSGDPAVFGYQLLMLSLGGVVVFLVLFTARDTMTRTESFFMQLLSIILVAGLPGLGFLMYLLLRPTTTIRERRMEHDLAVLLSKAGKQQQKEQGAKQSEKARKLSEQRASA